LEDVQGVGAGGVGGESPADVWCALEVDFDGADFAAFDDLSDVEVAEWCAGGGAAGLCLLDEALARLGGEVGRVELGVGGDDRVHEPTERRVVDVLRHRDQFDARVVQVVGDRRVVVAVASKPVNLVDDHVVQVALALHALQKGPECGAVDGLGGLATVHVLLDHLRVEARGLV